jgi:hypothetical protein
MQNKKILVSLVVTLCLGATYLIFYGNQNANQSSGVVQSCPPIEIQIDRSNSVHGLKGGILFAYVDLTRDAPALICHSDAEIQAVLADIVGSSVSQWWSEDRLRAATKAEVHIITILDKDEYAKASFNSALVHGQLDFVRESGAIKPQPAKLTFDNLRSAFSKK